MINKKDIKKWAEQKLEGSDRYLLDVALKPGNRIMVFIDGDTGITIDDCVEMSRFIESKLDREKEDFELQVSSAGADHPLTNIRQYRKNIGRSLDISLKDGSQVRGELLEVNDEEIIIHQEKTGKKKKKQETSISDEEDRRIPFRDVAVARVVLSFKSK